MSENFNEKLAKSIELLKNKKNRIYFLTQDTKGNAKASVRYIYQMASALMAAGFNPIILHEKNDYVGVSNWLDPEYMRIPHKSIENQELEVSPDDFLIVPEVFGFVMDQVKYLPCAKIVLNQMHSAIVDTLQPGQTWGQFGFHKCIVTSSTIEKFVDPIMKNTSFDVLEPYISDNFYRRSLPPMPIIGIHTKDHLDTMNIIKMFYLKYPQYRWFSFRDLRGLSEKDFAQSIRDCFVSVWVDDHSSYGTFPLESMKCGVPVIGTIPNIPPYWMTETNGIWGRSYEQIIDFLAEFIQLWIEDAITEELYRQIESTVKDLPTKESFDKKVVSLFESYFNIRLEAFENQLNKSE